MTHNGNIFACLVHEKQECVIDLVRNLRYLDPDSLILLYNGGKDERLLKSGFPFERHGAVVHPRPQYVPWGKLHPFALDCMQFALDHFPFRTLTIVDSDQLAVRPGYSARLDGFLTGRSAVGMLGSSSVCQPPTTRVSPAQTAHREINLWRPFLRRFPRGEDKFVHWTFWPSTVFTEEAARDLTRLFATDKMLQETMARTSIWASEEIVLPTLVALLGYQILDSPFSYEMVQYRKQYTLQQVKSARANCNFYWMHPIPRSYDHPLRNYVREAFANYETTAQKPEAPMTVSNSHANSGLLLTWQIVNRMKHIEGWLDEEEADLLIAATSLALNKIANADAVIEIGSYCGRSTCVIASVVKALRPSARVYAIDPHDGRVGALDQGIKVMPPTLEKLKSNLNAAEVAGFVEIIIAPSWQVSWNKPASLLFIDGLHDYANVARDFYHFEPHLVAGGYAAFHDYADYYPGVKAFVNELLRSGRYEKVHCVSSMMVVRRLPEKDILPRQESQPLAEPLPSLHLAAADPMPSRPVAAQVLNAPLVSCIMPTANRRKLVPQAIKYFLRQDYPNRELIILDDGDESIADLIPQASSVRYVRMADKQSMGAKHNLACEMASGEIIVHWDDDDWMANNRIAYQVEGLAGQPPATLCGLSRLIYYEPAADRAWEYVYKQTGKPWVCGNSFCYRKQLWQAHRFPARNEGADTAWVWGLNGPKVLALPNHEFYVAIMHPKNTSPKKTQSPPWQRYPTEEIQRLMHDDFAFYRELALNMELSR